MASERSGSYRIGERAFREAARELERLRIQARLAWRQELHTLERHGLRRDATVLEAGCGPGFVTKLLLEHVTDGSVTGLDVDLSLTACSSAGSPVRRVIPDQALDHMEAAGVMSPELARKTRAYLASIDSGEPDFEGMVCYLVVSGSA